MKTLYVTSLRHGLAPAAAAHFCRGIFALDVDVPGVPVARFRG